MVWQRIIYESGSLIPGPSPIANEVMTRRHSALNDDLGGVARSRLPAVAPDLTVLLLSSRSELSPRCLPPKVQAAVAKASLRRSARTHARRRPSPPRFLRLHPSVKTPSTPSLPLSSSCCRRASVWQHRPHQQQQRQRRLAEVVREIRRAALTRRRSV